MLVDLGPAPTKKKATGLLGFEQRMGPDAPFIKNVDETISTHKMAWGSDDKGYYAFPTIINRNGKLVELAPKEADEYAHRTGELKRFKTQTEAQAYAKGSWKKPKPKLIDLGPAPTPIMEAMKAVEAPLLTGEQVPEEYRRLGVKEYRLPTIADPQDLPAAPVAQAVKEFPRPFDPSAPPTGFVPTLPKKVVEKRRPLEFRAAPKPTGWQKFKGFFVGDRPPLPPDADRMVKADRAFDIAIGSPLRVFLKFSKGVGLNIPDLMWAGIKRITPESMWDEKVKNMNLDQAMDWASGHDPSGFEKTVGELAEFVGRLRTAGKIGTSLGLLGKTPKDISVLTKAWETAKLFGLAAGFEQVAENLAEKVEPTEAEYGAEGKEAILRDMAIGAILSIAHSGVRGIWTKLRPTEQTRALKLLGLKKGATEREIIKASRKMALKTHPDKAKGLEGQFKKIMQAREFLIKGPKKDIVYAKRPPKPPARITGEIRPPEAPITAEARQAAEITKMDAELAEIQKPARIKPEKPTVAPPVAKVAPEPTRIPPIAEAVTEGKVVEQNFTMFAAEHGYTDDYSLIDHSEMSPSGRISKRADTAMRKRRDERFVSNRKGHEAYRRAILAGEIIDPSGKVTKERLLAGQKEKAAKKVEGRIAQIDAQIRMLESVGKGKKGTVRPSYQKQIDKLKAERKQLARPVAKPEEKVLPKTERYLTYEKTTTNPTNAGYMTFISQMKNKFMKAHPESIGAGQQILNQDAFTKFIKESAKPKLVDLGPAKERPDVLMLTEVQKILDKKAFISEKGKVRPGARLLAKQFIGKTDIRKMTEAELAKFGQLLKRLPEPRLVHGKLVPPSIPRTTALTKARFFERRFKRPTPVMFITDQSYYAEKLGVKSIVEPLEKAKVRFDLEYRSAAHELDKQGKLIDKVGKTTKREKATAKIKNIPTKAREEIGRLLDTYEEAPADLDPQKKRIFNWFRRLTRTMLEKQNEARAKLDMPLIKGRKAYMRHIATDMSREMLAGRYPFPEGIKFWSGLSSGKKIFNPMEFQRKLEEDVYGLFTKDPVYASKAMMYNALKEIHLTQPLKFFNAQMAAVGKDLPEYKNLSPEQRRQLQASVIPASTRRWLIDYVRTVIKGQQTQTDEWVNNLVTQTGLRGLINKALHPFGRTVSQKPVTHFFQTTGRMQMAGVIGTRPKLIIRNKFQLTHNLGLYTIKANARAFMPPSSQLKKLLDESLFLKSYTGLEELPADLAKKVEQIWHKGYQWSAISNARQAMECAYWDTLELIENPKYKNVGFADPKRTYKEPHEYLYSSEKQKILKEMEFGASATQFHYIAMGMPQVFRHKSLIPFTRLQSWWMNYFAKFHREAIHRGLSGSPSWDSDIKLPWSRRLGWLRYVVLGGLILNTMGYTRSYLFGAAPTGWPPAAQVAWNLYLYIVTLGSDDKWNQSKNKLAKKRMKSALWTFVPGYIAFKDVEAIWSGRKDLSSLFFYKKWKKKEEGARPKTFERKQEGTRKKRFEREKKMLRK